MHDSQIVSLADVSNGELDAKFKEVLKEVLENMKDINYNAVAIRTIDIKLRFHPSPANKKVGISCEVTKSFPKKPPLECMVYFSSKDGNVSLHSSNPEQNEMFDNMLSRKPALENSNMSGGPLPSMGMPTDQQIRDINPAQEQPPVVEPPTEKVTNLDTSSN